MLCCVLWPRYTTGAYSQSVIYKGGQCTVLQREYGFYLKIPDLPSLERGFSIDYTTDILIYFKILVPNVFFGMRDFVSFDSEPAES